MNETIDGSRSITIMAQKVEISSKLQRQAKLMPIFIQVLVLGSVDCCQFDKMDPKKLLYNTLRKSIQAKNQAQIKEATQVMQELSKDPRYIEYLLFIANCQEVDFECTVAALAQLKNYLRAHWPQNKSAISPTARTYLLGSLLDTFTNLSPNLKYSKLLIDITAIVGQGFCLTIQESLLASGFSLEESKVGLMILLGISKSYRYTCQQSKLISFYNLAQATFESAIPLLKAAVPMFGHSQSDPSSQEQRASYLQIFYLALKIACKTVNATLSAPLRDKMLQLSSLCFEILFKECDSAQLSDQDFHSISRVGPCIFYQAHAWKWALKLLERVFDYIVISKSFKNSPKWHSVWCGKQLMKFAVVVLPRPSISKLKFHELRVLQKIVSLRPELFAIHKEESMKLLQQILPGLIMLTSKDRALAEAQPAAFIEMETYDRTTNNYECPRKIAVEIWYGIATVGITSLTSTQTNSYLDQSLRLINQWVISDLPEAKEVGLYLLSRLAPVIRSQGALTQRLQARCMAIFGCLKTLVQDESPWVGIRVLDVLASCGSLLDTQQLFFFREVIIQHLLDANRSLQGLEAIISIKSSFSLNQIFSRAEICSGMECQKIKMLLRVLLQILAQFEFEEVMCSFKHLIQHFGQSLSVQATEVVAVIEKLILWYIQRDQDQLSSSAAQLNFNSHYMGIVGSSISSLIALASLMTPGSPLAQSLETTIYSILACVLSRPHEDCEEYIQLIVPLLSTYLQKLPQAGLSLSMSFLLRALCFRIIRVPAAVRQQLAKYPSSVETEILSSCVEGKSYGLQNYLRVFRSFVRHLNIKRCVPIQPFKDLRQKLLMCSDLEAYMFMVQSFFVRGRSESDGQQQGKIFGILQLVYVLEVHGQNVPSSVMELIFKVIFSTSSRLAKYSFMAKYTLQLFSLWVFYQDTALVEDKLHRLNQSNLLILRLFQSQGRYGPREIQNKFQRVRVILGLSKFLQLILNRPQLFVREIVELLTAWVIYFTRQNLKQRGLIQDSILSEEEYKHYSKIRVQQIDQTVKECSDQAELATAQDDCWDNISGSFGGEDYELDEQIVGCYQSILQEGLAEQFAIAVLLQFSRQHPALYRQTVLRCEDNNLGLADVLQSLQLLQNDQFRGLVDLQVQCFEEEDGI